MQTELVISLDNIDIYQKEHLVLSHVNLHIHRGEFVYLIGNTGSGKSSIIKTIYGELSIQNGDGMVAGYRLSTLKNQDIPFLRRKLGIVHQDFQLLMDRSVLDNLIFVLKATGWKEKPMIENRIREVLVSVGLIDTLGKMPYELSGGEQQRLVIARAMLNHPEIILADEPTGHLDPEMSIDIIQTLIQISKAGTAILMATHNYGIINRFPQRVVRCQGGQVLESEMAQ